MCYAHRMSIGWIMFWKALILALIGSFQEHREKKKQAKKESDELLARFNEEWDRRSAEQPLLLTDRRSETL